MMKVGLNKEIFKLEEITQLNSTSKVTFEKLNSMIGLKTQYLSDIE